MASVRSQALKLRDGVVLSATGLTGDEVFARKYPQVGAGGTYIQVDRSKIEMRYGGNQEGITLRTDGGNNAVARIHARRENGGRFHAVFE